MCGIAGFIGEGRQDDLKRMNAMMQHRGPETDGNWNNESSKVFLGHKRLSIIDIEGGYQPMLSADEKLAVVFNGEIYNFKELRDELILLGHKFTTDHSDTEVLLYAYRQWGKEMPSKLNGMWAFAIYDIEKRQIFFSRDRFGKKPFFYSIQNGVFAFASELTALIAHHRIERNVSHTAIKKYFAYGYIPAPHTIFKNIFKLPGGHNLLLSVDDLSFRISRYWDFVLEEPDKMPENPEESWGEEIRHLLDMAVKRRLLADVPLGVFASGGIDSSAVAAYAVKHIGNEKLKTFSIGFDEASFDESDYAKKIASLLGTEHFLETMSIETALTILPDIIAKLDEPMGDSSLLPTYLLCRQTKKHVTVAVGGDGADELFAGYDPFRALKMANFYNSLMPKPVHKAIGLLAGMLPTSHSNMSLDFRIKRTLRGLTYPKQLWNPVWLGTLAPDEISSLFNEETDTEEVYSEAIQKWDDCRQENIFDKILEFYTKLYLQDDILVKVDRASMMNTLEVRAPFLDIELVNMVRKIPWNYKYRNGQTKYILKKALEPVLPKEILYRSKKGFGVPVGRWFKEGIISLEQTDHLGFLNHSFVRKCISEHRSGKADHRAFLWNAWLLEEYLKKV
jgi:asparagine synthase (glutamine-hydrolysing)